MSECKAADPDANCGFARFKFRCHNHKAKTYSTDQLDCSIRHSIYLYTSVSGNKVRVCYHLCIRHTSGTVFEMHQSLETMLRYFYIIKTKSMYRPSYAA